MCEEEMSFLLILQHLPPQIYNGLSLKDNTPYKINPNTLSIPGREDSEFLGKGVKEVAFFFPLSSYFPLFWLITKAKCHCRFFALKPIEVREIFLISLVWGLLASFVIIFQCK